MSNEFNNLEKKEVKNSKLSLFVMAVIAIIGGIFCIVAIDIVDKLTEDMRLDPVSRYKKNEKEGYKSSEQKIKEVLDKKIDTVKSIFGK